MSNANSVDSRSGTKPEPPIKSAGRGINRDGTDPEPPVKPDGSRSADSPSKSGAAGKDKKPKTQVKSPATKTDKKSGTVPETNPKDGKRGVR